jgi:hypothetical protein
VSASAASLPRGLGAAVLRGLASDPVQRHPGMRRLAQLFEAWSSSSLAARPRWLLAAGFVAIGACIGLVAWSMGSRAGGELGSATTHGPEGGEHVGDTVNEAEVIELDCPPLQRSDGDPRASAKQLDMLQVLMGSTRRSDPEYPALQFRAAEHLVVLGRDREACDLLAAAQVAEAAPELQQKIACRAREICRDEPPTDCGVTYAQRRAACEEDRAQCCAAAAIEAEFHCLELGPRASADAPECAEAVEVMDRACHLGQGLACRAAARLVGRWSDGDPEVVQRFHRLACEHGDTQSCSFGKTSSR